MGRLCLNALVWLYNTCKHLLTLHTRLGVTCVAYFTLLFVLLMDLVMISQWRICCPSIFIKSSFKMERVISVDGS